LKAYGMKLLVACGALSFLAGCGPSKEERALVEKDRHIKLQEERLSELEAEKARLAEENERKDRQKSMILEQNNKMGSQLDQMAKVNGQLLAENNNKVDGLNTQIEELKKQLENQGSGDTTVSIGGGRLVPGSIVIRVADTVLFNSGKADLKSSSHDTLNRVAATLRAKYPDNYIRVEGHTDSRPVVRNKHIYADNMALSQARAKAVFDYLVVKGVPEQRMYCAGYGANARLVAPEKSEADHAKNRRVDIVVLPNNIKVEKERLAANK
jgi:chemotaxis protein MotB